MRKRNFVEGLFWRVFPLLASLLLSCAGGALPKASPQAAWTPTNPPTGPERPTPDVPPPLEGIHAIYETVDTSRLTALVQATGNDMFIRAFTAAVAANPRWADFDGGFSVNAKQFKPLPGTLVTYQPHNPNLGLGPFEITPLKTWPDQIFINNDFRGFSDQTLAVSLAKEGCHLSEKENQAKLVTTVAAKLWAIPADKIGDETVYLNMLKSPQLRLVKDIGGFSCVAPVMADWTVDPNSGLNQDQAKFGFLNGPIEQPDHTFVDLVGELKKNGGLTQGADGHHTWTRDPYTDLNIQQALDDHFFSMYGGVYRQLDAMTGNP